MLHRLPLELVSHILDDIAGRSQTGSAYKVRQKTLSSLCRVSKSLRHLAQPLLWRVVVLKTVSQAQSLKKALRRGKKLAELATTLIAERSVDSLDEFDPIEDDRPDLLLVATVLELIKTLPKLERVYVFEFGELSTSYMSWDDKFDLELWQGRAFCWCVAIPLPSSRLARAFGQFH